VEGEVRKKQKWSNITRDYVSISSIFYAKLLRTEIPKVQKRLTADSLTEFMALLGSASLKAARKMLVILTLRVQRGKGFETKK